MERQRKEEEESLMMSKRFASNKSACNFDRFLLDQQNYEQKKRAKVERLSDYYNSSFGKPSICDRSRIIAQKKTKPKIIKTIDGIPAQNTVHNRLYYATPGESPRRRALKKDVMDGRAGELQVY